MMQECFTQSKAMQFTYPVRKVNADCSRTDHRFDVRGAPATGLWTPAQTWNTQQRWSDSITLSSPSLAWF